MCIRDSRDFAPGSDAEHLRHRLAAEAKIETLRSLKKTIETEVYYRDLEKLFLELAATNDEIETAQQE